MAEEIIVAKTVRVDPPSSSSGLLSGSAQTQLCEVVEGPDDAPECLVLPA